MAQLRMWAESVGTCPADSVAALAYHPSGGEVALSTNGTVNALASCKEAGCLWVAAGVAGVGRDHARHLHAEASLVAACARVGIALRGLAVKVTRPPCPTCALLLVAAGVSKVVIPPPAAEWYCLGSK